MSTFSMTDTILDFEFELQEMTVDPKSVVAVNPNRVAELAECYSDETPEFAVLRIQGGAVSGNGNDFADSVFTDVAEQINRSEKPGYLGHIKPEDKGYVFPEPQALWLAAKATRESGKPTLYVKGYLINGTLGKKHVKSGLIKTASWAGKASGKIVGRVKKIDKFLCESIDWSRPGSEGMDARVVAIVTEMEGSEDNVDWATATLADIRAGNPSLFDLMKQEVEKENQAHVSEMEADAEYGKTAKGLLSKVREALGLGDKDKDEEILTHVTEMQEERSNRNTKTLRTKIAAHLKDKIKNEQARSAVLDLIPISEMSGLDDDALVKAVDKQFEDNKNIQFIVTEMDSGPTPLTHRGRREPSGGAGGGSGKKQDRVGMTRTSTVKL